MVDDSRRLSDPPDITILATHSLGAAIGMFCGLLLGENSSLAALFSSPKVLGACLVGSALLGAVCGIISMIAATLVAGTGRGYRQWGWVSSALTMASTAYVSNLYLGRVFSC